MFLFNGYDISLVLGYNSGWWMGFCKCFLSFLTSGVMTMNRMNVTTRKHVCGSFTATMTSRPSRDLPLKIEEARKYPMALVSLSLTDSLILVTYQLSIALVKSL
jgi:hypothetical protein